LKRSSFNYGLVLSQGSGVLSLTGLLDSFVGEIFRVASVTCDTDPIGVIVNLYRDSTMNLIIGALLFYPNQRVSVGSTVVSTSHLATIYLGTFSVGSIMDPVGNLILNPSKVNSNFSWVIEAPAPGIIERESVFEPLQTGLISVDSMVPVGRGQRELVVGDRQTGKSALGIDTILNQKFESVLSVYLPIGQKASAILESFLGLSRRDSVANLSILVASASSAALSQFICSYTGAALAEYFMLVRESPSFVMFDDLSRHAVAYREIYLLLRRPPGREAYPGEIFFVHSRLLERSAKLNFTIGGGSSTSFPVIETLAGDVSAFITTNVISITDGQLFLSIDLFLSGIKPSIDVGLSVTRVGSAAQWAGMRLVSGSYKLELAQYFELEAFSQFASDLGHETKAKLVRGKTLIEMLKQFCGSPLPVMYQVGMLSISDQDLVKTVDREFIPTMKNIYRALPQWIFLLVPVRALGLSLSAKFQTP
jgi:F-type H+-transporting ATPase subunit alpha